jgi:predicted phosphate transport protein (TIGR00153 family)
MNLDKFFGFLVPKDRKFFPLFIEAADNLVVSSELLIKLMGENDLEQREVYIKLIKEAEHAGDVITHNLLVELNGTFITPFDREDIHQLISTIDDVVDYIHTAALRAHFYKLPVFPEEFSKIAEYIHVANKEIQMVLRNVKNASDFLKFSGSCTKISAYESEVDYLYQEYLSNLFELETNAINLIKKRDILASLEKAIDKCDDVANVFSSIIVKIS